MSWSLTHVLDTLAVCPTCHGPLAQAKDDVIVCQRCGDLFPVKHDIPVMYSQQLTKPLQLEVDWYDQKATENGAHRPSGHQYVHTKARLSIAGALRKLGCGATSTVLSVACGDGEDMPIIEVLTQRIVGIDIALEGLRMFRSRYDYPLFQGNVARMPFRDGAFDFVVVSGLLHHIIGYDSLNPYLIEVGRVVRQGGAVVCVEPNSLYPVQWALGPINRVMQRLRPGWKGLVPHERPISARFIMRQFTQAGFKNVACESTTFLHNRMQLWLCKKLAFLESPFLKMPVLKHFGWWTLITAKRED